VSELNDPELDELLEVLAKRMAAMSRLLASLSPEQRRQLEELAQALLSDMDLAFQMDQLAGELRKIGPALGPPHAARRHSDQPLVRAYPLLAQEGIDRGALGITRRE